MASNSLDMWPIQAEAQVKVPEGRLELSFHEEKRVVMRERDDGGTIWQKPLIFCFEYFLSTYASKPIY